MTFLPIVERELRVAAQRRATFWLRLVAALTACGIGGGLFGLLNVMTAGSVPHAGRLLFETLTWMALIAASLVGMFFTADALSAEKRDGTLGLLFLTDLHGYDVALGKLLATSCRSLFPLLAIFPIFAATQLLGGVAGGVFWRVMLALSHALFFSLICGLFVSALSRQPQRALFGTLGLLLVLLAGSLVVDGWWAYAWGQAFVPRLSLVSPFLVFWMADHGTNVFWLALLTSQGVAWGMFAVTCLLISRTWRERGQPDTPRRVWRLWRWRRSAARRRFRVPDGWREAHPVLGLTGHWRGQVPWLWGGVLILLGGVIFVLRRESPVASGLFAFLLLQLVPLAASLWIASLAAHLFAEWRRTRWVELLLVTPLDFTRVTPTIWREGLRLFGLPVMVVLLLGLAVSFTNPAAASLSTSAAALSWRSSTATQAGLALGGVIVWITDWVALAWFGFWMGLVSHNSLSATLKTLLFVKVLPWLVIAFGSSLLLAAGFLFVGRSGQGGGATTILAQMEVYSLFTAVLPLAMSLIKNWLFYSVARKRMVGGFRTTAVQAVLPPAGWPGRPAPATGVPPVIGPPPVSGAVP